MAWRCATKVLEVGRQRRAQPLLRNRIHGAVLAGPGNRVVDFLLQTRFVLVQTDVIRRAEQRKLLLRIVRRMTRENRGADVVADYHQLYLTRKKRRNSAVGVVEPFD